MSEVTVDVSDTTKSGVLDLLEQGRDVRVIFVSDDGYVIGEGEV